MTVYDSAIPRPTNCSRFSLLLAPTMSKYDFKNNKFLEHMFKNKLLAVKAADNVIRLLPPLIVKKEEIKKAINIIDKSLKEFK